MYLTLHLCFAVKAGKTVIVRNNNQAPMRMGDIDTKKDILRKVEDALNSHQPFYSTKVSFSNYSMQTLASNTRIIVTILPS